MAAISGAATLVPPTAATRRPPRLGSASTEASGWLRFPAHGSAGERPASYAGASNVSEHPPPEPPGLAGFSVCWPQPVIGPVRCPALSNGVLTPPALTTLGSVAG